VWERVVRSSQRSMGDGVEVTGLAAAVKSGETLLAKFRVPTSRSEELCCWAAQNSGAMARVAR